MTKYKIINVILWVKKLVCLRHKMQSFKNQSINKIFVALISINFSVLINIVQFYKF